MAVIVVSKARDIVPENAHTMHAYCLAEQLNEKKITGVRLHIYKIIPLNKSAASSWSIQRVCPKRVDENDGRRLPCSSGSLLAWLLQSYSGNYSFWS